MTKKYVPVATDRPWFQPYTISFLVCHDRQVFPIIPYFYELYHTFPNLEKKS